MNQLYITTTGDKESNQILSPSVLPSYHKKEINLGSPLLSLKSNVKPHVLLEKLLMPRVLRIPKEDFAALCQVVSEFQEQF